MILERLRNETKDIHDSLEENLNLLRPDLTVQGYVHLLQKFYGFYLPLEEKFSVYGKRAKTQKLEEDLNFFNVKVLESIPRATLPEFKNSSEEIGMFYVVEGSTLGGLVLTKHFTQKFHLREEGIQFFSGYGKETLSMWNQSREIISSFTQTKDSNEDDIVKGAIKTFQALSNWLIS